MTEEIKDQVLEGEQTVVEEPQAPSIEDLQKQIATLTAERDHLKDAISASNSDASKRKKEAQEWKEKYTSTLDEQARKELADKEEKERINAELSEYKQRERLASYKSKLMSAGYDDATAQTMASTLPEGIGDDFFESQKQFLEARTQAIQKQFINSQPSLSVGMPPSNNTETEQNSQMRKWFGLK